MQGLLIFGHKEKQAPMSIHRPLGVWWEGTEPNRARSASRHYSWQRGSRCSLCGSLQGRPISNGKNKHGWYKVAHEKLELKKLFIDLNGIHCKRIPYLNDHRESLHHLISIITHLVCLLNHIVTYPFFLLVHPLLPDFIIWCVFSSLFVLTCWATSPSIMDLNAIYFESPVQNAPQHLRFIYKITYWNRHLDV